MQYMKLPPTERQALLDELAAMPDWLEARFGALPPDAARRSHADAFSPVEQVWHLADLEREGFGERIRRLKTEPTPRLPDFDGARIAAERDYRARSLHDGLAAFAAARRANLDALPPTESALWSNSGTQEGVGAVSLCDVPLFMQQHDASHRAEIDAWLAH